MNQAMKPLGLALPSAHLLATAPEAGPPRLALGGPSLDHLVAFADGLAAALPRFGEAGLGLEVAAARARDLSAELGAAADARAFGDGAGVPASLLGQVGAVVGRLAASASEIAAAVVDGAGGHGGAEGALRRIADLCLSLRRDVSPLIDRLDRVGAQGAAVLAAVAEAQARGATALEALQEAGGRRRERIRSLRERAGGGLFGSSRGRAGPGEIAALDEQDEAGRRAEAALRDALAALEPLHREAAWFGPAVRDARAFLATLRQTLTDVGSGVSQAQSDWRVGRGAGRPELEALLGGEAARERWSAIAGASRALADRLNARGGAPTKGRVP